jgi:hypothetical protein
MYVIVLGLVRNYKIASFYVSKQCVQRAHNMIRNQQLSIICCNLTIQQLINFNLPKKYKVSTKKNMLIHPFSF